MDALAPVLDAFDSQAIIVAMRPHVDKIWRSMEDAGDHDGLLNLMEVFWFVKSTDTLLYILGRVEELEPKPVDPSEMKFEANSNIPSLSLLSIISVFQYSDNTGFRMALDLLYKYLAKVPIDLQYVIYILTDRFSFTNMSYLYNYSVQRTVIDALLERMDVNITIYFQNFSYS